MPHAETEWKIIYFEEEEPEDTVSRLPIAGHASLLKILVPHNQISKYTKQEEGGAGGAHVLKNQDSNILVTILAFQRKDVMEEGYWGPLAQFHAEWDRRPEQDGYFTFYSVYPVVPLTAGETYYHELLFFDATSHEYLLDLVYHSECFQL